MPCKKELSLIDPRLFSGKLWATLATIAIYIGSFPLTTSRFEMNAAVLTHLLVLMIGWFWGIRAGVGAALVAVPLNMLLLFVAGRPDWNISSHPQNLLDIIDSIIIGAAAGYMRKLKERARQERDGWKKAEETLSKIAGGISDTTEDTFFRSLAEDLAYALNSEHIIIGELSKEKKDSINTVAALIQGTIVENFEYSLEDTPCENVVAQKLRCFPRAAWRHFPKSSMLRELGIESFIGTPLINSSGKVIGVICVMDGQPLENPKTAESMLRIFAVHASAKLEHKWADDSLKLLKEAVESLPIGITIVNTEGQLMYLNPAEAEMHGYRIADLTGRNARILAPRESWHPLPFEELHALGIWKRESVNMRANGERFPVQLTSKAVKNADGVPIGVITACEDITERKRADDMLRESETSYRTLSTNLPGIVYRVHVREDNRMQIFNNMFELMTGYMPQELMSGETRSFYSLVVPDDRNAVVSTIQRAVTADESFEVEYCIRHKHGEIRKFLERGRPVRGQDGSPSYIDGVILDITEHMKMEEKLIQRQEALRSVYKMATTPGHSFKSVCDDVALSLSSLLNVSHVLVLRRLERKTKIVSGIADASRIVDDAICPESCACSGVFTTKKMIVLRGPLNDICPHHPLAGHGLQNLISVPVVSSGGDVVAAINLVGWTGLDIDEDVRNLIEIFARYVASVIDHHEMEERLRNAQQMEVIGRLTGGVAHEVRNPLHAIMALSDALAKDLGQNPEYQPFLAHIHLQVERLSALMTDLLELGKPVNKTSLRKERLSEICSTSAAVWENSGLVRSHKVRILSPSGDEETDVVADSQKLQQVMMNLLDNAAQHSPDGSEIQMIVDRSLDGMCRVRITDRGAGIPKENIHRIFEPFFSMRKGGTGLGMSIVKHLVEAHQGMVSIENNDPPPGCTVEIRLPCRGRKNS